MSKEDRLVATLFALAILAFILVGVTACNDSGGDTYVYPQDTSHGYYDVHHHYHYYPQYHKGSKRYVVPAPRSNRGPSLRKSGGFRSSGGSRRR